MTVAYGFADVTATAGQDYTAADGVLALAAGATSGQVTVALLDDALDEADEETFTLTLSGAGQAALAGGGQTLAATGTIADDDDAPELSIADARVTENVASGEMVFAVALSTVSGRPVTVEYATAAGTATEGADYAAAAGVLALAAGARGGLLTVAIVDDLLDEPDETFYLSLAGAVGAQVDDSLATGTIADDDPEPGTPGAPEAGLSIVDAAASERDGALAFTVLLGAASGRPVTVRYATEAGTAAAGDDYTAAVAQVLTFAPGDTERIISVPLADDALDEADETFSVQLSAAEHAVILRAQATGTIHDDDDQPVLTIADAAAGEPAVRMTFPVTLTAPSGLPVTVTFVTADGSATADTDYTATGGTLVIAAGQTAAAATVTLAGDDTAERAGQDLLDEADRGGQRAVRDRGRDGARDRDDRGRRPAAGGGERRRGGDRGGGGGVPGDGDGGDQHCAGGGELHGDGNRHRGDRLHRARRAAAADPGCGRGARDDQAGDAGRRPAGARRDAGGDAERSAQRDAPGHRGRGAGADHP